MDKSVFIAFLRGINSGQNPSIKMQFLREAFEAFGFKNVKTVLASGNVIFEVESKDDMKLEHRIEKQLPKKIGFESSVTLWRADDLLKLYQSKPFKDIESTSQTKLYATFIKQGAKVSPEVFQEGQGFRILEVRNRVVLSVVDLRTGKTTDLMQTLDKQFGKTSTTRNWNTIERIIEKAAR
jgi:uncharacterized protein (DUF1697 family)